MKRLIKKANIPTIDDFYNSLDYEYEDIGLQQVKVDDIVGMSYPRNEEYNNDFSPKNKNDERWLYQYNLVQNGYKMEPISLNLMPNGKYTIAGDGNHRLSVAKYCGLEYIDAYVFKMVDEKKDNNNNNENSDNELTKLKKRYEEIWNELRTNYSLNDEEVSKLEDEMFNIIDKIEEAENN